MKKLSTQSKELLEQFIRNKFYSAHSKKQNYQQIAHQEKLILLTDELGLSELLKEMQMDFDFETQNHKTMKKTDLLNLLYKGFIPKTYFENNNAVYFSCQNKEYNLEVKYYFDESELSFSCWSIKNGCEYPLSFKHKEIIKDFCETYFEHRSLEQAVKLIDEFKI